MKNLSLRVKDALADGHPDLAGLKPGTRLILQALAAFADDDGGGIRRSISSFCAYSGLKPRTVKRRLTELRKAGVLAYDDPGGGRRPATRRITLSGVTTDTPAVSELTPQQCQNGHPSSVKTDTAGVSAPAPQGCQQGHTEVSLEVSPEVSQDIGGGSRGGWPASPAMDMTPAGPNAPPTRKQLAYIASLAEELELPASPEARTKNQASKLIEHLRAEAETRRARRLSTARTKGRRQGLVDGKHEQAAEASKRAAAFIKEDIRGRARR